MRLSRAAAAAWAAGLGTVAVVAACSSPGSHQPAAEQHQGDPSHGRTLIEHYGCGSCHEIPGVDGADGLVGPPLTEFGRRSYIAGQLPNNATNLERWIQDPPGVEPGTAMPDLGVGSIDARDIAAYLLSLG
jgi:cytochrome c1